jgi:hypothetical protein
MSLRDDVENLLPNWQSWYPSIFDAAVDLGLIRARVCSPGSLLLSQRHASVYQEAVQAFREQWSVVEPEGHEQGHDSGAKHRGEVEREAREALESETDAERIMRVVAQLPRLDE